MSAVTSKEPSTEKSTVPSSASLKAALAASAVPEYLFTAAEVREFDRLAIAEQGIPGFDLMQAAAAAAFASIDSLQLPLQAMTVFCGHGNNGGDGFLVAALAHQQQWQVQIVLVGAQDKIAGDARRAYQTAREQGVPITGLEQFPAGADADGVWVDALLGTGIHSPVRGAYADAIALINASAATVFALDIPSGINSDTGAVMGAAVRADHCISFIARKRGAYTGAGPAYAGAMHFADLNVPAAVFANADTAVEVLRSAPAYAALPPRYADAHKGRSGHVLIIGGNHGMAGAALMAASAALRCGAGLVSVATRPEHIAALVARQPELMAHGIANAPAVAELLPAASVVVVGPGLGQDSWAQQLLCSALDYCSQAQRPLLLDADALNLLASGAVTAALPAQLVLTPHPGEAARLLGLSTAAVQDDRFAALRALQEKTAAVCILKGAGSLVSGARPGDTTGLCVNGNPGMATAGMGDILSGVIGALLAQGLSMVAAARLGVLLHAQAGDACAATAGELGLLATDLLPALRRLLNAAPEA